MKNLIEQYIELSKQRDEIFAQLNSLVRQTAWDFCNVNVMASPEMGRPDSNEDLGDWEIDNEGNVIIQWESFWRFGGHAAGEFSFPAKYLYDQEAFNTFKQEVIKRDNERKEQAAAQELARKQAQLAQLKKELNVP